MRTQWTDSLIAEQLLEIYRELGCMPSSQRLKESGKNDLSCAIVRSGGFLSWARRLGIDRKRSCSDVGWDGEIAVKKKLEAAGHKVERSKSPKAPFDLLVRDCLKVDVKSASYKEYGPCRGWFYRVGKTPQADVIALLQSDTGDVYWIPWYICPRTNITISRGGGIYSSFRNSMNVVDDMILVRASELLRFSGVVSDPREAA